eukprot:scaffold8448_cov36-Phaeocystis_antarctica.AAC.1
MVTRTHCARRPPLPRRARGAASSSCGARRGRWRERTAAAAAGSPSRSAAPAAPCRPARPVVVGGR